MCREPVEAEESVKEAYEEYYACVEPLARKWRKSHPEIVERLERQYEVWLESRTHDLRDRDEAARFVDENPVDFARREAELSRSQVAAMRPSEPRSRPAIEGEFQRMFVDGEGDRLFLTSAKLGLISVDISRRYSFEVDGSVDEAGAEDFFIVDEQTAIAEEKSDFEGARDLVVIDISDRADPEEIRRLPGAVPAPGGSITKAFTLPSRPPTFEEYRAMREGTFQLMHCGDPPRASSHTGQRCQPDGRCYRQTVETSPRGEGYCERHIPEPMVRPPENREVTPHLSPFGAPNQSSREDDRRDEESNRSKFYDFDDYSIDSSSPSTRRDSESSPSESSEEMPEGGDGGAGALSQMMVHDSTLFVLTGTKRSDRGWLTSFDISDPRRPELSHLIELDNGPEALQRHDHLLLIAGREALVTASAADDGLRLLGEYRQDCPFEFPPAVLDDPVVVEGSFAYRTVIFENPRRKCRSRLEVIDLSQPQDPTAYAEHPLSHPRGLAVLGKRLFVADRTEGVRVFDITEPLEPELVETWGFEGVEDLILHKFDLYAMTKNKLRAYYVAPLFEAKADLEQAATDVDGVDTLLQAK
ncbi:MAG: hypothetical protein ACOCV2_01700 [Persicimonas sp.]